VHVHERNAAAAEGREPGTVNDRGCANWNWSSVSIAGFGVVDKGIVQGLAHVVLVRFLQSKASDLETVPPRQTAGGIEFVVHPKKHL
jgi:hypothetical protein